MRKKIGFLIIPLIIVGFVILTSNCKKEDEVKVPVLTTTAISDITLISAKGGGEVTSDGGADVTARGVCWGKAATPTIENSLTTNGSGIGVFTSDLTGLTPGTTYYVRAYATNSVGTGYGTAVTFSTGPALEPTVTTAAITGITNLAAACGGNVTDDGGATVTARGVCWSTSADPTEANSKTTDGAGLGTFTSALAGLVPNTTYHVRAYAINSVGTGYGADVSFTTEAGELVNDIDGNVYHTVTIFGQVWMVENLKVTHYRNGEAIPLVDDDAAWAALTTGGMCYMDKDITNATPYGGLYNTYAVNDVRNISPAGWHVATLEEWTTLLDTLGGEDLCGNLLKETGTDHWAEPNTGATNETGFTAVGGGYRETDGAFNVQYSFGLWLTSTPDPSDNTLSNFYSMLRSESSSMYLVSGSKVFGMSVRCIKD